MYRLLLLGFLLTIVRSEPCTKDVTYGIVMDAGSSGTRVYVYCYNAFDATQETPEISQVFTQKVEPGLSEYWYRLDELDAYLKNLLDASLSYVPETRREETPSYIMATAGLRLIGEGNATKVFEKVDEVMQNKDNNPYYYQDGFGRILSGEEEGLFAWITVNYLLNNFKSQDDTKIEERTLNGIVEMGGASAQMAFYPTSQILANKFSFLLGGTLQSIYVNSYLGYGQDQMASTYRKTIVSGLSGGETVADPCRLRGDNETITIEGLDYTFSGTGNPTQCQEILMSTFFNPTYRARCLPYPCAIGNTYQPSFLDNHPFYALSAFRFTLDALNVLDGGDTFTPHQLRDKAFEFCQKHIQNSAGVGSRYCLSGMYFPLFLERLGFDSTQSQIKSDLNGINGEDVNWPLGALIYQLSQVIDQDEPEPNPTPSAGTCTNNGLMLSFIASSTLCILRLVRP